MQVTSALLVDEVRKHPNGQVDLLGLFEDIYLDALPVTIDSLTLFLDLELSPEDRNRTHVMELRLVEENGRQVQPPRMISFDIPGEDLFPRTTAQLDLDFPEATFRNFGGHYLEVLINGAPARRVYLSVQPGSPDQP